MREITIGTNEAGQRLDKFLAKYLRQAGKSFLYKMIRKKNITLNGKRCEGAEKLAEGDVVRLFLSEETIEKFSGPQPAAAKTFEKAFADASAALDILYEDDDILLFNKPVGMLSQQGEGGEASAVEYLIQYLLRTGAAFGLQPAGSEHQRDPYGREIPTRTPVSFPPVSGAEHS